MKFSDKMKEANRLLKPALRHAFDHEHLAVQPFAAACGLKRGKVDAYVYGTPAKSDKERIVEGKLSVEDFAKVYDQAVANFEKFTDVQSPTPVNQFLRFAQQERVDVHDIRYTEFGKMLRNRDRTGRKTSLSDLKGVFYVVRRNASTTRSITVSAIKIDYDELNNICVWENWQEAEQGVVEPVHGLATEYDGMFHFFGFAGNSTTLHAMSIYRLSPLSAKYVGVVMTTDARTSLVSRVVMVKQPTLTYDAAREHSAWVTEEDLKRFGVDADYLDNECEPDGVISNLTHAAAE